MHASREAGAGCSVIKKPAYDCMQEWALISVKPGGTAGIFLSQHCAGTVFLFPAV